MARRSRILAFGSAAVLVAGGAVCAALVDGLTGEVIAIALTTLGLGGAVLLVFLEVGLSEDHERAREEELRGRRSAERLEARRRPRLPRRPRRPG